MDRIEKLKEQLKLPLVDMEVIIRKDLLKKLLYENITKTKDKNDIEKCKEMDDLAQDVITLGTKIIAQETLENQKKLYEIIKENYQFRARRYFRDFLIATEWNFSDDMKLYGVRKLVFDDWAEYLQDLEYGKLRGLSISAPPRTGKALSMDSKILTPKGWKLMKDMQEGDMVIGADGKPAEVLGVFPQGIKDMYRVSFDDGTSVKCSGDHLWTVQTRDDRVNKKKRTVKTTDMLKNVLVEKGKRKNYTIDYVEPVEFENNLKEDDLHPYLLGALIGDGYICYKRACKIGLSSKDEDLLKRVEQILPETDKIKYDKQYDYTITKKKGIRNKKGYPIKSTTAEKICEYELYGCKSESKFIPRKYLYSSVENRIELLRGLMDTDGYADGSGTAEYATVSSRLADDITELARSLGGRVTKGEKNGSYIDKNGNRKMCKKVYRLYIKMPLNPFWIERKASKYITRDRHIRKYKYITSIERIPDEECQCIYVNNKEHLFVTDGYNLTHNTAIGTQFFMWCMLRHPEKSCFFVSHTRSNGKESIL